MKKPLPATPPDAPEPPGTIWLTVAFSLAVVAFVIGAYQTVVEKDLPGNYWIFMIAAGLWFWYRYQRKQLELRENPPPAPPPARKRAKRR